MPDTWQDEPSEQPWSDREAWRGEIHLDNPNHWLADTGDGWVWPAGEPLEEESEWPEDLAGPEYWMFRRECDD
jgi:hypothetical protein